jgi:ankyrin repeat protein
MRGDDGLLPAMRALYERDPERALALLPGDDELAAHEAAAFGRVERLRALLDEEPGRVDERSPDGFTPLHLAIFGGQEAAVRELIARGADVEAVASAPFAAVAPLGTAVFVRSSAIARILLDAGADPHAGGATGHTPLDAARQSGDPDLVRLLSTAGG